MRRTGLIALSLMPLAAIAGCQQFAEENYLTRSDTLTPYSGDALAANTSNQTIDPWKRYAYDRRITTSGNRQAIAYDNYNDPEAKAPPPAAPAPVKTSSQ